MRLTQTKITRDGRTYVRTEDSSGIREEIVVEGGKTLHVPSKADVKHLTGPDAEGRVKSWLETERTANRMLTEVSAASAAQAKKVITGIQTQRQLQQERRLAAEAADAERKFGGKK